MKGYPTMMTINGPNIDKAGVTTAINAVMQILRSASTAEVKIVALNTLRDMCRMVGTNISNCTFTNKEN
jgi:hypothetical protein